MPANRIITPPTPSSPSQTPGCKPLALSEGNPVGLYPPRQRASVIPLKKEMSSIFTIVEVSQFVLLWDCSFR